jgi:ATP-dependent Lhr-like helicase
MDYLELKFPPRVARDKWLEIIFRELLANELAPLQWRAIFRSLRLMELSGEVLSGYFFEGVSGPQFISPEAFRMLQEPLPQDAVFWVNATDPASLCGLGPVQGLPPRISSTHLVYHGSKLVMISKRFGKSLDILVTPEDGRLAGYFVFFKDMLSREFNPLQKVSVESINGEPALQSRHADALKQFGFKTARNSLELWKEF